MASRDNILDKANIPKSSSGFQDIEILRTLDENGTIERIALLYTLIKNEKDAKEHSEVYVKEYNILYCEKYGSYGRT